MTWAEKYFSNYIVRNASSSSIALNSLSGVTVPRYGIWMQLPTIKGTTIVTKFLFVDALPKGCELIADINLLLALGVKLLVNLKVRHHPPKPLHLDLELGDCDAHRKIINHDGTLQILQKAKDSTEFENSHLDNHQINLINLAQPTTIHALLIQNCFDEEFFNDKDAIAQLNASLDNLDPFISTVNNVSFDSEKHVFFFFSRKRRR